MLSLLVMYKVFHFRFFLLKDNESYVACQEAVSQTYKVRWMIYNFLRVALVSDSSSLEGRRFHLVAACHVKEDIFLHFQDKVMTLVEAKRSESNCFSNLIGVSFWEELLSNCFLRKDLNKGHWRRIYHK